MCVLPISNSEFSIVCALPISNSEFSIVCVSKQYQCWGVVMCARMLIRATAQRGCTDTVRESAPEADREKNALPHRNSNPRQFYAWLFTKRATNHEQFATRTRACARDTRMHAKRACKHAQVCPRKLPEPFKEKKRKWKTKITDKAFK